MEVIPRWITGKGIELILANPENCHHDPAAESREPWSGRYWVHQEWQPYYLLKKGEDDGIYQNIQDFGVGGGFVNDPNLTEEEIARRKNMIHQHGRFNNTVMVSEFHGTVLSPRGEELLPRAGTPWPAIRSIRRAGGDPLSDPALAGRGFFRPAESAPLRWPGLIQGIRALWYFVSNLLSLHADNLNWVVNPMMEMNSDDMVNPMDNDIFPGKIVMVFRTQNGQPVIRTIDRNARNNDILAMASKAEMIISNSSAVDQNIFGLSRLARYTSPRASGR